ncbi:MAG: hypothetical protein DI538_03145 [Azospira oryzae]|jgi:hypothetical protein|nr:MAG: hypothetical protein DI538_03145 [Azospira oryzae]
MIRSLTLTIFILAGQFAFSSPDPGKGTNCKAFRTGKYKLVDKERAYRIERDQRFQIETDLSTNETTKFKVTWVNRCEYELNIISGREDLMIFFKDKTLVIRILEIYENGYQYEARLKGIAGGAVVHTVERIN